MLEESLGRVYPNARGKLPWITGICGKNRHRKPQERFLAPWRLYRMDTRDFRSHQRRAQRLSLLAEDDPKVQ